MSKVLIFDLDDTLYDERTYVESGFRAVAFFGREEFGWDEESSFAYMIKELDEIGRGSIFDNWLKKFGKNNKTLIQKSVNVYRHHTPRISIFQSAKTLLPLLVDYPLYIVTDGHKLVQEKKVEALGVEDLFRHIYITHRYGVKNAKPSTYCFELIKKRENCRWDEMVYVGDNPAKDFVGINPLGVMTVRVLTGSHKNALPIEGYGANHNIPDLSHFLKLIQA